MTDRSGRRIVAALSDTHGGHLLGLLNPATVLVKASPNGEAVEWTPELNTTQRKLWREYTTNTAMAAEFAGDDELLVFHDGDATQGDAHNHTIPDTTREDQREIAYFNLVPLLQLKTVKKMRLLTGTEIHVPESAEARIAWRLARATGKDVRIYNHDRPSVDGVIFDVAHHGPHPGTRDWLFGNVATLYLRDRVYRDRRLGRQPAAVYLRGHYHHWVHVSIYDEWEGRQSEHHLVILPSFCGLGEYARKATRSDPTLTTGIGLFEVVDGRLGRIVPVTQTWDLRTEEEL